MKSIVKRTCFIFLFLIVIIGGCSNQHANTPRPKAIKGTLDLSDWDFETDGSISLDGQWEFYWMQLLQPKDLTSSHRFTYDYIHLPSFWNKKRKNHTPLPKFGSATYHLTIKTHETDRILAVKLAETFTNCRVWINGKEIFPSPWGTVNAKAASLSQYASRIAYFTNEKETIDIVMQISNLFYKDGGIRDSIKLGLGKTIAGEREVSLIVHFFLFGCLCIMGIYHVGLFILNRRRTSTILFGLFCLIMASRIIVTDESYIVHLIPGLTWAAHLKIIVLEYYIGFPVFFSFLYSLYPEEFSPGVLRFVQFTAGIFCLFALGTPVSIFPYSEPFYQIFAIVFFLYALFNIIKAFKNKRNGAGLVIVGFLFLFISVVNDILYANQLFSLTKIQSLLPIGFFAFVLIQSYILAKHFSKAEIDANRDELTQVNNRRYFMKVLQQESERAQRMNRSFSLLSMDIDHFKSVNDTFGHDAGDLVLIAFSKTIQNHIRKIDVLGRMGGEEFSVLLPETDANNALIMAERLRRRIEELEIPVSKKRSIKITISIGITESHSSARIDELLKTADKALYEAKNSGRNRVVLGSSA